MSVCLILVLCLTSVYCADWNTFQHETNTTIILLKERLDSLNNHVNVVTKPQKETIDVFINFVKDELGHVEDFEKSIKPELDKNYTLASETSFVDKTKSDIKSIHDKLTELLKKLTDEKEKFTSTAHSTTESPILRAAEAKYLKISHKVSEYFLHKTNGTKTEIVSEIVAEIFKVRALIKELELIIKELLTTHSIPEGSNVEKELFLLRNIEAVLVNQLQS